MSESDAQSAARNALTLTLSQRERGYKRRAFKLLLFLLAGAIINVAVAWGCARLFKAPMNISGIHETGIKSGSMEYFLMDGKSFCIFQGMKKVSDGQSIRNNVGHNIPYVHLPPWVTSAPMFGSFSDVPDLETRAAWGWPSQSLAFTIYELTQWRTGAPKYVLVYMDAVVVERHPSASSSALERSQRGGYGCLPLRPIFPGFAINTIFYAAVLWVLFAAPFKLRRWRRIKRGQCASCGYSLRGRESVSDKCPECGRIVSK